MTLTLIWIKNRLGPLSLVSDLNANVLRLAPDARARDGNGSARTLQQGLRLLHAPARESLQRRSIVQLHLATTLAQQPDLL